MFKAIWSETKLVNWNVDEDQKIWSTPHFPLPESDMFLYRRHFHTPHLLCCLPPEIAQFHETRRNLGIRGCELEGQTMRTSEGPTPQNWETCWRSLLSGFTWKVQLRYSKLHLNCLHPPTSENKTWILPHKSELSGEDDGKGFPPFLPNLIKRSSSLYFIVWFLIAFDEKKVICKKTQKWTSTWDRKIKFKVL